MKISFEILDKFYHNIYSQKELQSIIAWFREPGNHEEIETYTKKHWDEVIQSGNRTITDYDRILDKVHHRLNMAASDNILTVIKEKKKSDSFIVRLYKNYSKIAAIILIPLLVLSLWNFLQPGTKFPGKDKVIYSEMFTPNGSKTKLDLPDGSTVWLNDGSKLRFPQQFNKKTRTVYLNGEAYFNIHHNSKKPFVVKTPEINIRVLGTKFNVMAYMDESTIETTVEEGKVLIERINEQGDTKKIVELGPDQQSVYNKNSGETYTNKVNTDEFTSWKDGKLILRNDPLEIAVKKLERWYNVDIKLIDPELAEYTYSATIIDESITTLLDYFKMVTPIDYTLLKREEGPDGTLAKQSIEISIRQDFRTN